ncbi:MAG: hypothetical protein ACYC0V_17805, partial [Armatimonadota bacterium]
MRAISELDSPRHDWERWIWIELIGFDNAQSDFGVSEYLNNIGFIPNAVSLFITSPDFVHMHSGIEVEVIFPPDYCSYNGHSYNADRERQVWTNHQLKALVAQLHKHGIEVYFSVFTFFLEKFFERKDREEWVSDHKELLERFKSGQINCAINALKRLKDGSYYEDFFIPRLVTVVDDYGFDGWHAADGWGPLRLPVYECDYSDDMIKQFTEAKAV